MAALALHFVFYNFVKIHTTLRVTPAMAAGFCENVWEMSDIVKLVEQAEQERNDADYGTGGPGKRMLVK